MTYEEMEKNAIVRAVLSHTPGIRKLYQKAMLNRIAATFGPHAAEGLKSNPAELAGVFRLLKRIPKGGTTGVVDLSQVAPGFSKDILKGKALSGDILNKLLIPAQRNPVLQKAVPDSIAGMVGESARKNPFTAMGLTGGLGYAASRLAKQAPPQRNDGSGRSVIVT